MSNSFFNWVMAYAEVGKVIVCLIIVEIVRRLFLLIKRLVIAIEKIADK